MVCSADNFSNAELLYNTHEYSFSYIRLRVAPNDYTAIISQPVIFSSAPSQMCVSITIINDFMIEPNEVFTLLLESTDPAVQLILAFASVTILDSCKSEHYYNIGTCVAPCFQHCCSSLLYMQWFSGCKYIKLYIFLIWIFLLICDLPRVWW